MNPLQVIALAHSPAETGDGKGPVDAYADNATTTTPGNVTTGREAMGDFAKSLQHACPDAEFVILNQIVSGDTVAEEFRFEGTHTAVLAFAGSVFPPTGRRLQIFGALFIKVVEDKIVAERVYLDEAAALSQLG